MNVARNGRKFLRKLPANARSTIVRGTVAFRSVSVPLDVRRHVHCRLSNVARDYRGRAGAGTVVFWGVAGLSVRFETWREQR